MANNVAASMKASIVIDKKELISSALSAYAEAQKELDGNKIELLVDVSDDKALKKLKEIQKELTGKEYILKFKNQGTDEILENLNVLENKIKEIFNLAKGIGAKPSSIFNNLIDVSDIKNGSDELNSALAIAMKRMKELYDAGEKESLEYYASLYKIAEIQKKMWQFNGMGKKSSFDSAPNVKDASERMSIQDSIYNDFIKYSDVATDTVDFAIQEFARLKAAKEGIFKEDGKLVSKSSMSSLMDMYFGDNYTSQIKEAGKATEGLIEATKELVDVQKKVDKIPTISAPIETNISSPIKDTFQRGHSDNSEPAGVTRYQKHGYKARDNGNHDNEVAVSDKKKLGEALKGLQNEIIASIDESTQFIKEVTDFYDSNDNLVKTQMKIVDQIGNMSTYTTSYSQDKDGNMTAWTSHITTEKLLEAKKAEEKIEKDLQKQKDSFNKKNLTAIDLEIQKREELSKITSSDIKTQMEERQKLVSSMESEIKSLNERYDALNLKPSDANRSVEYQGALDRYKSAITDLQSYLDELNKTPVISEEQKNHWNELIINANKASNELKSFSAAEKGSTEAGRWKEIDKISKYLDKNTRISKEAKQELKAYLELLKSGSAVNIEEIHMQFNKVAEAERLAGREGKRFLDILSDKALYGMAAQLAGYYLSLTDFIRYGKEGINVVRELDTALTEMRKVSDETVTSLERFQDISFDLADDVGSTAKQIQNSTADWMRLGEAINDASESAEVSNILLNVSEFDNIDSATESLVAMSQAYRDLEKIEIVDVANKLGNEYAISTDGLATALQNSASALKTAQNDYYEAAALATAANTVVQDPSKVGAGLRTIALRLTGTEAARKELEELGEDISDFQVTTTSKLNQQIMDLTKTQDGLSVSLLDMNGNYRSTYEILLDIAKIWDKIAEEDLVTGENRQNALLEMMAGKNRSNILASILQSPNVLEEAYKDAKNASGSAQEELDKYLESIDGRMQKLENQAQEFWFKLIDSDTIKGGIDLLTGLLDIATKLVDTFGAFGTAAMVGGGILGAKNIGREKRYPSLNMPIII